MLRFLLRGYLRVRLEGTEWIPAETTYLLNFSHPNWIDPFLLVAFWPDRRRRLLIFGPKEEDMRVGWRNRVIRWGALGVPFKPSRSDLIDTTRRATGVLREGYILSVAGEGRLSDREGAIVPLQDGPAFFALRAGTPILPLAIIGTRWLRFGKRITMRIGEPLQLAGRRADRPGVASLTAELQAAMEKLLDGVTEDSPPGPFGRWLTDAFNERPWLNPPAADDDADRADGR